MHLLYRPWAMAQKDKGVVGLFGCLKTGYLNGDLLAYLQSSWVSFSLIWASQGPGHHFIAPNFVGILFNFAKTYLGLGGFWVVAEF